MNVAKITKINLKNYKVFDDVKIELNQCNVFVGPNSSGKSSIAEFLIFFRDTIRYFSGKGSKSDLRNLRYFLNNGFKIGNNKPLIFNIEVIIGGYYYEYFVEIFPISDKGLAWANERFTITRENDKQIVLEASMNFPKGNYPNLEGFTTFKGIGLNKQNSFSGSITYLSESILKKNHYVEKFKNKFLDKIEQFYEYWDNIRFYDFNAYNKKEICKEVGISDDIILSEDFQNLMTVLLNLNFQQKEIFEEIKDWLIRLIPNFRDLIIQTSNEKGNAFPSFSEEGWYKKYAPLIQASDGIIRILCILTILFNNKKPILIILDEPENGIHPAIRNYIADFSIAASDDTQVILLTHDSGSLKQFELDMIYYFKRKSLITEVKRLSAEKSLTETIKALKDIEKNTVVSTHISDSF